METWKGRESYWLPPGCGEAAPIILQLWVRNRPVVTYGNWGASIGKPMVPTVHLRYITLLKVPWRPNVFSSVSAYPEHTSHYARYWNAQ
jgi:hypothetical protein